MDLEQLLARESIRHCISIYNNTGDRGKIDDMMECFTDTATLHIDNREICGKPAIKEYFYSIVSSGYMSKISSKPAKHHVTSSRIELDESKTEASSWSYFLLISDGSILQHGIYIDNHRLTESGWKLSKRRVKVDFDLINMQPA